MGDATSPPPPLTREAATPEPSSSSTILPIRILTHNIRFATDNPNLTEKLWQDRLPYLSSHFKYHTRPHFAPQSTIVCMQEVLHGQLLDLHQKIFNTSNSLPFSTDENDWTYVGVGRNDGKTEGEYSPIFFRKSAWKCIHFETVWLNETREVGKKGWDADSIRILTCAVLESVLPSITTSMTTAGPDASSSTSNDKRVILAMNTHLDNEGKISRRKSAKVILDVSSHLRTEYSPSFTFLCGDLNSEPDDGAYLILNTPGSGFVDTRRLIPNDEKHPNQEGKIYAFGNELTFTDFPKDAGATGKQRIDFVHLGIEEGVEGEKEEDAFNKLRDVVQSYGVLPNRFDDRVWMSDHRGVVVDLLIPF